MLFNGCKGKMTELLNRLSYGQRNDKFILIHLYIQLQGCEFGSIR